MRRLATLISAAALTAVASQDATAHAEVITRMEIDPTSTQVYWRIRVDEPADAYKIIIRDASGTVVRARLYDPAGMFTNDTSSISGLTPGTDYTLTVRVRWSPGTMFKPEWRTVAFKTNS